MFFSFEGIDGVGKTTQLEGFVQWLRRAGHTVVVCRDPGGTPLGERLREMLLTRADTAIGRRAEMLLYMASRAQLVDQVIRPALDAGHVVVCDRFLLANVVYQAYGGGLDVDSVWRVGEIAIDGVSPQQILLLDLGVAEASARRDRAPDRMESQGDRYMERVRQGYLAEAARRPEISVIDAGGDVNEVQARIRGAVAAVWPSAPR